MKFENKRKVVEKGDIIQRFTKSSIGGVLFIILAGILLYNIVKSSIITSGKLEILNQAEKEVSDLRLNNLDLIVLTEYMTSNEYLETEARNRLNLSKKGEVSFVIPEEALGRGILTVEDIVEEKEVVSDTENWEVWRDFFVLGI